MVRELKSLFGNFSFSCEVHSCSLDYSFWSIGLFCLLSILRFAFVSVSTSVSIFVMCVLISLNDFVLLCLFLTQLAMVCMFLSTRTYDHCAIEFLHSNCLFYCVIGFWSVVFACFRCCFVPVNPFSYFFWYCTSMVLSTQKSEVELFLFCLRC